MSTATRTSRRRRLLQEGIASQSSSSTSFSGQSDQGPKARFAPRPGSVSFALAAALPRSLGGLFAVAFVLVLPLAVAIGLEAVLSQTSSESNLLGQSTLLHAESTASFASWWSSASWLLLAGASLLVFGLRRRRMDDLRGGYRWWIVAAICCIAMSFNAATHAHALFASWIAGVIGWSPLVAHALWWLVPGVLILGGLSVRLFFEMLDSRLAAIAASFALLAIGYGWLAEAQLVPLPEVAWAAPAAVAALAVLGGQTFALIGLVCYVRRIVLETEGAVAPPAKPAPSSTSSKAKSRASARKSEPVKRAEPETKQEPTRQERRTATARQEKAEQETTVWTDGGDDFSDDYDEQPKNRKLTKAERKRLRKQKARRAA